MPKRLTTLDFDPPLMKLPKRVLKLLADADEAIERFQFEHRDQPVAAFVPCDFVLAYQALDMVTELNLAPGHRFVEWGSGAGVVTCLAAMLGWDAVGIEIEDSLVDLAIALADEHEIEAQFVHGSFVPEDCDIDMAEQREINWLDTDGPNAYEELDLEPDDFDLVFAYPWPGEEQIVFDLFRESAAVGTLLLTYHGQEGVKLQRKTR